MLYQILRAFHLIAVHGEKLAAALDFTAGCPRAVPTRQPVEVEHRIDAPLVCFVDDPIQMREGI